jgi:hypothetical protein
MCLLKVREALDNMVSSDSWKDLEDRATTASDRHEFQEGRIWFLMVSFGNMLGIFYSSPKLFTI